MWDDPNALRSVDRHMRKVPDQKYAVSYHCSAVCRMYTNSCHSSKLSLAWSMNGERPDKRGQPLLARTKTRYVCRTIRKGVLPWRSVEDEDEDEDEDER